MKAKTVNQVLKAAEWMLENVGWTQGTSYRGANGANIYLVAHEKSDIKSMCLAGAFNLVEVDSPILRYEAITAFIDKNGLSCSLAAFNDNPGTTRQDVVRALRKART